eukprot:Gregarina_sp_Poly_1__523@NODE_1126_length_5010_cov_45_168521_g690_i2_p5_GENE_NODE_1126_length_5010_cov_45_168521_g690_i2NODE_1126_length_5010_cov_45_168521_g690_i2_p5_ORF_typecomplete_len127_score17_26_NODE_1126_length_5010_cov_45_168521_g690_i213541734
MKLKIHFLHHFATKLGQAKERLPLSRKHAQLIPIVYTCQIFQGQLKRHFIRSREAHFHFFVSRPESLQIQGRLLDVSYPAFSSPARNQAPISNEACLNGMLPNLEERIAEHTDDWGGMFSHHRHCD